MRHIFVQVISATHEHIGGLESDGHLERGAGAWQCWHDIGTHGEEVTRNPGLDDEYQAMVYGICDDPTCDQQVEEG